MEIYTKVEFKKEELKYLGKFLSAFFKTKREVNNLMFNNDSSRIDFLINSLKLNPNHISQYDKVDENETIHFLRSLDNNKRKALIILIQGLYPPNTPNEHLIKLFPLYQKSNLDLDKTLNIEPFININKTLFNSYRHSRIEDGNIVDAKSYSVTRYLVLNRENDDTYSFIVADENQQIVVAPKIMKVLFSDNEQTILNGFGKDENGFTYTGYGVSLNHQNGGINRIFYHWFDRNITIEYI